MPFRRMLSQKQSSLLWTRISSRQDRTACRRGRGGWYGYAFLSACPGRVKCLSVIRSWTKSVKWAKSPVQTPGPGRTNVHAWMGPNHPPGEYKMWCKWWDYQFLAPGQTHIHTYKAKPIHPHVAGCNQRSCVPEWQLHRRRLPGCPPDVSWCGSHGNSTARSAYVSPAHFIGSVFNA